MEPAAERIAFGARRGGDHALKHCLQMWALKFIDMSLSESAQTCFANELRYTPTNSKAVLTPDVAATVAYGQVAMKDLFRFDAPTIEANRAGWVERWSKTIAR